MSWALLADAQNGTLMPALAQNQAGACVMQSQNKQYAQNLVSDWVAPEAVPFPVDNVQPPDTPSSEAASRLTEPENSDTAQAMPIGFARVASASRPKPCEEIVEICRGAGFAQGRASGGNGLIADCVNPILQGTAQPHKASKPLPQIDPQVVAACKAKNPGFGHIKASTSEANGQLPAMMPPTLVTGNIGSRPNFVFILTDDLATNLVQYMPHVLKMQKEGVTFSNYFVTDSLCCPSRSSIFTGRYPHDTGVFKNTGKDGGYLVFRDRGLERSTFATSLLAAGYRTAMLGKYLNEYKPVAHAAAPGWTTWAVAGNGYPEYNYNIRQDSRVVHYGRKPADYLTDVLSGMAVRFIRQAPNQPFFIEVATFAPHAPYTPAPRDADAFPGLRAPRTPAFNAVPDMNAPKWLRNIAPLTEDEMAGIDADYRKRAQSVLAVDKMIGELQAALAAIGQEKNTYFIFSSDNGLHMGEHRLRPGKMTAFDIDIHVPLIITGPGVPAGRTIDKIVENIDLCPTFTELGGAAEPVNVDGHSLVALLQGQEVAEWRTAALVEHHGPLREPADPDAPARRSGNPPTYEAVRTHSWLYVEYEGMDREYYDLIADPHELRNVFLTLTSAEKTRLHTALDALKNCHDAKTCWNVGRAAGSTMQR
jgi:N-acetylglucosamine-6-sulfatase